MANGECFTVITPAATDFTWDEGIRQKLHLDANCAIALTGFASSALYIE
jgi:hypothetical protein